MNKQIYDDRNKDGVYFWGGQVCLKRKQKETFWNREIFYIFIGVWKFWCKLDKNYQTLCLTFVYFTVCKFCLNKINSKNMIYTHTAQTSYILARLLSLQFLLKLNYMYGKLGNDDMAVLGW